MDIIRYLQKSGLDTVSSNFYSKIKEWGDWYMGNVPGFSTYRIYQGMGKSRREKRYSLQMAKTLCDDMANFLLNERCQLTIDDNTTNDFVQKTLENANFAVLGNQYQERKCALGTVGYVPYISGEVDAGGTFTSGSVKIDYCSAENIFPISWDNGRVTECAFAFPHTIQRKKYVHLQLHLLDENGEYYIENRVIRETQGGSGRDIDPSEWEELLPFKHLAPRISTRSKEPQFVIDKLNLVNNADADDKTNPMGVALFAQVLDIVRGLDLTYDSFVNEFRLGRKRIFVAPEMLQNVDGDMVFDSDDTVYCLLPDGFFEGTHEAIHESNMTLRVTEHESAIQSQLQYLSAKCGFGGAHYQYDRNRGVTTATAVISENSDLYRTIKKHEIVLDSVFKELIRIIIRLGKVCQVQGLKEDAAIMIRFDDSIIEDTKSQRDQDRQDVAAGLMNKYEYRMKYYSETEEQARKNTPKQAGGEQNG